jgi:hypothetical protein
MTETAADIGFGAEFGIEGETPGTYVALAEVVAITPPGMTREKVEATHLKSPEAYKEYIAALFDTGDVSLTLNFVPSATDALFTAFHAASGKYQITFPNGVMMRFNGFFTGYTPPELTPEGKMESTATVARKSGKPTLHAAAGAAPVNSVLPAVSGVAQEGETLTAFAGIWSGGPTFAFQWQELISAVWTNISGATSQTLVVPGGSTIGRPVRVVVTASNAAGSATANSVQTAAVIAE